MGAELIVPSTGGSAPSGTGIVRATGGAFVDPAAPLGATDISAALDAGSGTADQVVRGDGTISALRADDIRGTVTGTAGEGKVIADDGASGLEWITPSATDSSKIPLSLIDAKGDLLAGTAADTAGRLPIGSNNQFLVADNGETTGLKYRALVPGDIPMMDKFEATATSASGLSGSYADNIITFNSVVTNENTCATHASGTITCNRAGRIIIIGSAPASGGTIWQLHLLKNNTSNRSLGLPNGTSPFLQVIDSFDVAINDTIKLSLRALDAGGNLSAGAKITILFLGRSS